MKDTSKHYHIGHILPSRCCAHAGQSLCTNQYLFLVSNRNVLCSFASAVAQAPFCFIGVMCISIMDII